MTGQYKSVLVLSIDGLHNADLTDPKLKQYLPNITALEQTGVTYSNAYTSSPSDSFPGTMNLFTGASPKTTGIYYDVSYSRSLYAPGTTNPSTSTPGTKVALDETIDKNSDLLSGGGNFGPGSIDPSKLPVDSSGNPVYPHSYLKVNTVFDVAHAAGLHTAYSDKHAGAYEIVNGPSGNGVDDFYSPEIDAKVALENGKLVDQSTAQNPSALTFQTVTKDDKLTEAYDDLKVNAILNEIDGKNSLGTSNPGTPAIFGMNFQAVSVAQKDATKGGIAPDGTPSAELIDSLQHTDQSVGKMINELKQQGLFDNTLVVLTAKHGQNPRVGSATLVPENTFTGALQNAGIQVGQATQDDVDLIWLKNQSQTDAAAKIIENLKNPAVDKVLYGDSLVQAGFGNPAQNDRTPDIVLKLKPGYVISDSSKRAEHGGLTEDDKHVALIAASGGLDNSLKGSTQTGFVSTKQVAVSTLEALGLNPNALQGAKAEGTKGLPGLNLEPSHKPLLDLRDNPGSITTQVTVNSQAAYNDFIGYYPIVDTKGTIIDNGKYINPGDKGYAKDAISEAIKDFSFSNFGKDSNKVFADQTLPSNVLLAPFMITNGDINSFLKKNSNNNPNHHSAKYGNDPLAYFAFNNANPDKLDHVHGVSANTLGFDDLFGGGGQNNFNDVLLKLNPSQPLATLPVAG